MSSSEDNPEIDRGTTSAAVGPVEDPLADIPPLATFLVESEADKIAALRLIADSIAQQRQAASRILIFHPLNIAAYVLVLGLVSQLLFRVRDDLPLLFTTAGGVTMAALVVVRSAVGGYLFLAEKITLRWLRSNYGSEAGHDDEDDNIIVTRFGNEIIGAVVLRLIPAEHQTGKSRKRRPVVANGEAVDFHGKALVRAWTVKLRYRHKGVGGDLLVEGIKLVLARLGPDATIEFAKDHASTSIYGPIIVSPVFPLSSRPFYNFFFLVIECMSMREMKKAILKGTGCDFLSLLPPSLILFNLLI